MRTILCMNAKGGCGKTTLATNLATWFADDGKRVALVDLDPQYCTLDWLAARNDYDGVPEIQGIDGTSGSTKLSHKTDVVIYDAPAGTHGKDIDRILRRVETLLIPVLPSPMDMRAGARFIEELLGQGRVGRGQTRIALVENRVRETTRIFHVLEEFLNNYRIPVLTHLRESQNYIRAAGTGLGIFELAPSAVAQDVVQWDPIVDWLGSRKSLPRAR